MPSIPEMAMKKHLNAVLVVPSSMEAEMYIVKGVLSKRECEAWIHVAEELGMSSKALDAPSSAEAAMGHFS